MTERKCRNGCCGRRGMRLSISQRMPHGRLWAVSRKQSPLVTMERKLRKQNSKYNLGYGDEIGSYPAPTDCYIIGTRENPVVSTGDRIAFVGTEWTTWQ